MPKDKTASHSRVLAAAKAEFMEKGFEGAAIRSIGRRAGMTSAGLYRHCKDKEDLFAQVLSPMLEALEDGIRRHETDSYAAIYAGKGVSEAETTGELTVFRTLFPQYREEFKLLLCGAQGTRYENFLHDLVTHQQKEMQNVLKILREQGYPAAHVSEKEMHLFLSAYLTAIVEPVIHDYSQEETELCLQKIADFFMPGWRSLLGLDG